MTVKDILNKICDNYVNIMVNEFDGCDRVNNWVIEPHKLPILAVSELPESIQNREVAEIIPYFDSLSIDVDVVEDEVFG